MVFKGLKPENYNIIKDTLIKQKKISLIDPPKIRDEKIAKAQLQHILIAKLQIDPETYKSMGVNEIFRNEKGDITVNFIDPANVGLIYSLIHKI